MGIFNLICNEIIFNYFKRESQVLIIYSYALLGMYIIIYVFFPDSNFFLFGLLYFDFWFVIVFSVLYWQY
jgi:hypothetical protein